MAPVTAPPPPSGCRCGTARALPRAGAVPGLREGAVRGPCAAAVSLPVPLGARAAPFPGRPGGPRRYAGGIMAGASGVSPLVCALQRGAQAWRMGHRPPLCRGHFNNPHLQYPTCCAQGDGPGPHNPPGGLQGTGSGLAASPGRSPSCPPARKVSSLPWFSLKSCRSHLCPWQGIEGCVAMHGFRLAKRLVLRWMVLVPSLPPQPYITYVHTYTASHYTFL